MVLFDPHKKRVKFEIFEKSQNFEKIMIFLKVYPLCTPFTLFALFCKMSQKVYPDRSFEFRLSVYIMQSCLPTTIYVQNLSFLVTQISNSYNFFSI